MLHAQRLRRARRRRAQGSVRARAGRRFRRALLHSHLRRSKFPMDAVIFTGSLPENEYREERGRQWDRLQAEGAIDELRRRPPSPRFMRWIRVFGISAWLFGLLLLGLILHGSCSQ